MKIVPYDKLKGSDLIVDAVYEGGNNGNAGDDPIAKLLNVGNQGGFRRCGSAENPYYLVIYTSGEDQDWPDSIDYDNGIVSYYGDNKSPGHELHDTPKKGNLILRNIFEQLHKNTYPIKYVPPIFLFKKHPTQTSSRSVQFKGLCVPGSKKIAATDDLVAVWRSYQDQRFQNYKAIFTMLDESVIKSEWIKNIEDGCLDTEFAPKAFMAWINKGVYKPLLSKRTINIRTIEQQLPNTDLKRQLLKTVFDFFKERHRLFEFFAADIFGLSHEKIVVDEVTRGVLDGGRDALGRLKIGFDSDPIYIDFALEAKCYNPGMDGSPINTVGVKETSRLISRIRNRQFGVLVTTSAVAKQAYEEIKIDSHPIIIMSGSDIINTLYEKSLQNPKDLNIWLSERYM